jgi:hypothetical protein
MKYSITHICGHGEEYYITGRRDYKEWRIKCLEQELCPECKKKEELERIKKIEEEFGLQDLQGSEKQIEWARTIRADRVCDEDATFELIEDMAKITSAKWWIDNKMYALSALENEIKKNSKRVEEREKQKLIDAECTVFPENMTTEPVTVRITVTPKEVQAECRKNDEIIEIMHECHFRFCSQGYWYHYIGVTTGTAEDRAAELMNKILTHGHPVICDNEEVRKKAIEADYEEEFTRWIKKGPTIKEGSRKDGDYLTITIGYNDGTYEKWKDAGARYSKPDMIIKVENWETVKDVAERLGYRFTERAEEFIQTYREASSHTTKVKTKLKENEKIQDTISDEEKLLAELMDD